MHAVAGQRGADPAQLGQAALGGGGGVQRVGARRGRRRARRGPGRAPRRRPRCAATTRLGSTGSRPSPSAPGSSVVKSTTRARLRSSGSTSATTRPKSVSTSAGCSGASAPMQPGQAALGRGRTRWRASRCRWRAGRPGRRRGRRRWRAAARRRWRGRAGALARRRRIAGAGRGEPARRAAVAIRPALVRPVSSTQSTRRSRSGRHCLTTTCSRRALPRQSIERGSSPITYSRSESNSLPWPRPRVTTWPSMTRSRDSFSGSSRRDRNSGSVRSVHGGVIASARRPAGLAEGEAERPVRADRDPRRGPVAAPGRGEHGLDRRRSRPGRGSSDVGVRLGGAGRRHPGVADHAPAWCAPTSLVTCRVTVAVSPRRTWVGPGRGAAGPRRPARRPASPARSQQRDHAGDHAAAAATARRRQRRADRDRRHAEPDQQRRHPPGDHPTVTGASGRWRAASRAPRRR